MDNVVIHYQRNGFGSPVAKPKVRHEFAKLTANLDVVEPVEFRNIITSAAEIYNSNGMNLVQVVLNTVANMITNVEVPQTLQRLNSIMAGRNRTPPTPVEHCLICLAQDSTRVNILNVIQQLELKQGVGELHYNCISAKCS